MKVTIMGAGALGSVFGGFLSRQNEVALVGRKAHIQAIRRRGLQVSGLWGDHLFTDLKAQTSVDGLQIQDLVLITTKSYDTAQTVQQALPLLHAGSMVVSMQNGIGNEETVAAAVGRERTLGGMAIFGAVLVEPGHVEVTVYAAECKLGALAGGQGRAEAMARMFSACGIPTLPSPDILAEKWLKAFYNIALNPLSAILRVPYGVLGEHEETRAIMRQALEEAFAVAAAEGVNLKASAADYFRRLLQVQLPPTAQHRSSMLQDIQRGKATEINYLNGLVVRLGQKHGIPTPVNGVLVNIVKVLEGRAANKGNC
ncbi:MAG: ketopantoate reductase family protein [Chloroflexota bacterium]